MTSSLNNTALSPIWIMDRTSCPCLSIIIFVCLSKRNICNNHSSWYIMCFGHRSKGPAIVSLIMSAIHSYNLPAKSAKKSLKNVNAPFTIAPYYKYLWKKHHKIIVQVIPRSTCIFNGDLLSIPVEIAEIVQK